MNKNKNEEKIFAGIDASYNGFAVVIMDLDYNIFSQTLLKSNSKETVEDRILSLEEQFFSIPQIMYITKAYIEGPSFSSSGAFILEMGALNYYFRILLYKNKINYEIIPPTNLKKFVTGQGNVKKELMLLKTFKKWGVEFDDNNICDAYCLCRYAIEDYKNESS